MKLNKTHEGATARTISPLDELKRTVLSCLLWEDQAYEDGKSISERIAELVPQCPSYEVASLAILARTKYNLRHVPLYLARLMARLPDHKKYVSYTLNQIILRPDELCEFLAIYWKNGREKLSSQVKKGLALAFTKFNAYQLAKYNQDGPIKLKDVMALTHPKPINQEQALAFKQLMEGTLPTPNTWEVKISQTHTAEEKRKAWSNLLDNGALGGMALMRNLRNMTECGVPDTKIREALKSMNTERILPYRFINAARYAPQFSTELEIAMRKNLSHHEKIPGTTILLVDVSGSMDHAMSMGRGRSAFSTTRIDAACGLAILLREVCESVAIITFSSQVKVVPLVHGFDLAKAITSSQAHSSTQLGKAVQWVEKNLEHDRLIVITDEQSQDEVKCPANRGYMINVASYQHGVGYGKWKHVDGFSESVVQWIIESEKLSS